MTYPQATPRRLITMTLLCALACSTLYARGGSREDRMDRVDPNEQRDFDRAQQRAAEEKVKEFSGKQSREAKEDQNRTKDVTDAEKRAAKEAEDAAKDAEDAAEEAAKEAEEAAKEAAKAAEEAAEEAAEAAEEAAEAAAEAAEENHGSSESMRDLATSESPDQDRHGFPVRRGEIVALDLRDATLASAQAKGFAVIERTPLAALDSTVTRLSIPKDMDAQTALATMRAIDADGAFDLTHYYAMQFATQGVGTGAKPGKIASRKGNLKIGMIDTGVTAHRVLSDTSLQQRDFGDGKAAGPTEHGTAIASLLARDGASQIYAANIFRGSSTRPFTSADAIVRALDWMVGQDVPVINISLAGPRNKILDKLISRAVSKGHVIVAAAGNGGPTAPPAYPAALPNVVAVTAVDRKLQVYRYANQGGYITVSAYGVDVPAAAPGGGIGSYSGTSFATPHIAAWLARCAKSINSTTRSKCISALAKSAKDLGAPGKDEIYGLGYIS